MNIKSQYYFYIALVIICLGIGLRLIGLDKGIWLDEYSSLRVTVFSSGRFVELLRNYDHPPTYYLLLKLWSSLNASEVFLRIPSVSFGVLTIVVIMAWLKPFSSSASLLSGLVCATTPILLRYSQEIRDYSLLILATAFSFYCASRIIIKRSSHWYLALTAGLSIAVTTHLIGIMVLPSICIYLFPTLLEQRNVIRWSKFIISISVPVLIFGGIYFFFLQDTSKNGWWMPPFSIDLVISTFKYALGLPALFSPVSILGRYHPILSLMYDYAVKASLILYCGCLVFFGGWRRSWLLLVAAGVYWLEIIAFSVLFTPVFWYRTILPGIVPLIGFVGMQSDSINLKKIKFAAIINLGFLCLLFATGWATTEARVPNESWKQVAEFLEAEYRPGNLVAFYPPYTEGPTRYYFPTLQDENAIPIYLGTTIEEKDLELTRRIALSKDRVSPIVLFVVVRPDLLVEEDNVAYSNLLKHLDSLANRYSTREFSGLIVWKYELHR